MLASLRRAWPDAEIDWLVQDAYAPAIEQHPALTRIVPFPRKRFGVMLKRGRVGEVLGFLSSLRKSEYDLVLDCQGLLRSGIFAFFTRAPRRLGFADAREWGWLGVNERVAVPSSMHTVDRMLALVGALGIEAVPDMRLYAREVERNRVRRDAALAPRRYVVIAPTSRWAAKRWPPERFAAVAESLLASAAVAVVLVGAASERDQVRPLLDLAARDSRVIDRVGSTSIAELMALVESAALVIANDSASLHMAVGFDRPAIGLFGPTRVDLVGPYRREGDVIQHVTSADHLDHKHDSSAALMERISVDEVVVAAMERIAKGQPAVRTS